MAQQHAAAQQAAPNVQAAVAAGRDGWMARIEAIKAEATANRDKAVSEAHDLEVRLGEQHDILEQDLMGVISHNARMAQKQRQASAWTTCPLRWHKCLGN